MRPFSFFVFTVLLSFVATATASAQDANVPDCTRIGRWPAQMALTHLENAIGKTGWQATEVKRLASEKIGEDMFRQIHLVKAQNTAGERLELVTVNNASSVECSESGVTVFVVARQLGKDI